MKKLLLVLLSLGFYSCQPDPVPCNPECWKITDLKVSEVTGSLRITFTNPCNKSLIYNTYVINEANYHLYSIGDIICEDDFPNETIGNQPPSI